LSDKSKCMELTQTLGASSDDIARALAECDLDQDGQIDFEEFLTMMQRIDPWTLLY